MRAAQVLTFRQLVTIENGRIVGADEPITEWTDEPSRPTGSDSVVLGIGADETEKAINIELAVQCIHLFSPGRKPEIAEHTLTVEVVGALGGEEGGHVADDFQLDAVVRGRPSNHSTVLCKVNQFVSSTLEPIKHKWEGGGCWIEHVEQEADAGPTCHL